MKSPSKVITRLVVLCCAIIFLVFVVAITIWLTHIQSLAVVAQWKQPASVQYDGVGPYYLSVFESDYDWRGFPLDWSRRYSIYVGRDSGSPSYGHELDFTFYPMESDHSDVRTAIKNSKTEWQSEGVLFITTSGHRLFIPKDMFTGGR
jgi:hypothetical protein